MPDLDFAFLCDYVRSTDVVHVIGGGIDTAYAPQLPAGHNLGLAARFTFTRAECGNPHRVDVVFADEDGHELVRIQGTVTPEWVEGLPLGWKTGALLGLNFGVPLPAYGVYSFDILLNGSSVKSLNFRVLAPAAQPPAALPPPV